MKKTINGKRYKFVIGFIKDKNNFYFEIEAIDLKNKTHSFINNVNCILSQFDIDSHDGEKMESMWKVKEKEGKRFFKQGVNFISSRSFREYLERQLNLDQELGEWNKY